MYVYASECTNALIKPRIQAEIIGFFRSTLSLPCTSALSHAYMSNFPVVSTGNQRFLFFVFAACAKALCYRELKAKNNQHKTSSQQSVSKRYKRAAEVAGK